MEDTNMKKTYINPVIEIIKLTSQQQMLTGSTLSIDPSVVITNEDDLLSRESDFNFDNF